MQLDAAFDRGTHVRGCEFVGRAGGVKLNTWGPKFNVKFLILTSSPEMRSRDMAASLTDSCNAAADGLVKLSDANPLCACSSPGGLRSRERRMHFMSKSFRAVVEPGFCKAR